MLDQKKKIYLKTIDFMTKEEIKTIDFMTKEEISQIVLASIISTVLFIFRSQYHYLRTDSGKV